MNLSEYLRSHELTQRQFADRMGVTPGMVWHWLNGASRITAERACQIEAVTDGAVKRHELRPDLFDPPAQALAEEGAA
jgi:DNA-binding transcriptional regulator YdaS (Cro superfamily)